MGYSLAMLLLIAPIAAWSMHGTRVTWANLWTATQKPLVAGLVAATAGLVVKIALGSVLTPIPYLLIGVLVIFGVYAWTLLIALGQKAVFMRLADELRR